MSNDASLLIIACGALAKEITALIEVNGWQHVSVQCLPAELHNRPEEIPGAVQAKLNEVGKNFDQVFMAYADCGTGGKLDKLRPELLGLKVQLRLLIQEQRRRAETRAAHVLSRDVEAEC